LYRAGHIPGAVFCDLDRDLAGPPGEGGRHPLPIVEDFQASMRRLGVEDGRPVVAYDGGDGAGSARAWWCLRYFGHRDVRVLDGGYQAWLDAGQPTSTAQPPRQDGDFTARSGGMPTLDRDGAAALAKDGVLLDARTPERYRGEDEPIDPVAGHIPGAINAPVIESMTAGRLRSSEELRERFAALGAVGSTAVGAYCGSGVTAAQLVLALHITGVPAALYVGSWSNWITDPSRPVATGAGSAPQE
jgi:thiosulfate/3-mercaptopyruvate sulfurtransferase